MAINIQNISVSYDDNQVLENLNLELSKNKVHGIVGLNGAGKTTLLHVISGALQANNGKIVIENEEVKSSMIGFLETQNFFYHKITGKEYLNLFKVKNPSFKYDEWNSLFKLPLKKYIETYSTGMKKKLAFLAVLSLNRSIMILDEPFNGLDLEANLSIKKVISELKNSGKTIIITSHILDALTGIADQIHYLSDKIILKTFEKDDFNEVEPFIIQHSQKENSQLIKSLVINKSHE